YREALHPIGCDVVEAPDGREALTKAFVRPPALLITELRLPIVDGYALCEILRRDRTTSDVPILVVTTETRPLEIDHARQAGATAVLVKPTDTQILLVEAQRLLARPPQVRERSMTARDRAAAQLQRSAILLAKTQRQQMLSRAQRFATTTPPLAPPRLICPVCDRPLKYERSHVGGVNAHSP